MLNPNQILQALQQLKADPMRVLQSRFNIPHSVNMSDPNQIIQHLLNTGQTTQGQVNMLMNQCNNPMFRGLFK